jgi:serine/threonine protein kinase
MRCRSFKVSSISIQRALNTATSNRIVRFNQSQSYPSESILNFKDILLATNSVLKLVDFGAAKVIVKGNKTMARTRAARQRTTAVDAPAVMNSLAGTPMYMAPEIIRNEKPGRLGASDIWSMGCVILEIATG